MSRLCRVLLLVLVGFYLFALVILLVGTFGLFGQERDPLSAIFVVMLGLPWTRLVDVFPELIQPWLAAATPLVNIAILWAICRRLSR